jgi:hypothetical protein
MFAEEILKFHPELQAFLDDIEKKGWTYLYIETRGTSVAEIDADGSAYRVRSRDLHDVSETGPGRNVLEIELGQKPIILSGVPEVQMFKINVSTKSFPRAVTVDIAKGLITYLNDAFWGWQEGWEKDAKRISEAREVHEVAKWLLEVKKQRLEETYDMQRYNGISRVLAGE